MQSRMALWGCGSEEDRMIPRHARIWSEVHGGV
jgi:hypothetical protein